jgi:glycerol-3-phosphate acyltransferase PlsY
VQLAAFIVALIWARHYENIGRLVRGTEKSWKQRDRAGE